MRQSLRTAKSSWLRRSGSATASISTIFPCVIEAEDRSRPRGATMTPTAPFTSAGLRSSSPLGYGLKRSKQKRQGGLRLLPFGFQVNSNLRSLTSGCLWGASLAAETQNCELYCSTAKAHGLSNTGRPYVDSSATHCASSVRDQILATEGAGLEPNTGAYSADCVCFWARC